MLSFSKWNTPSVILPSHQEEMLFRQLSLSPLSTPTFQSMGHAESKWTKWVSPGPNGIRRCCNSLKLIILEGGHDALTMSC